MKSSNILSSTSATGINPAVASTSASNAPAVTTPDGSSPVTHGTLLLAEKLRSEKLESLQEFAFSLGLTAAHLQCLVGIFMPIETGGAPKQYKFELSHREEKNRQSMLFDGASTLRIDGDDSPPRAQTVPTRLIPRGSGEIPGPEAERPLAQSGPAEGAAS